MQTNKNSNYARFITDKGLRKLEEMWLEDFHSSNRDQRNSVRWWNVIHDFLELRGDEIIPGALREQEYKVIQAGKSQEYLAALAEIINKSSPKYNEYDKTVLVLTASPEERAEALRKVFADVEGKSH